MASIASASAFYEALKKEEHHERIMTTVQNNQVSGLALELFLKHLGVHMDSMHRSLGLFRSRFVDLPYAQLPFAAKGSLTDLALLNPHFRLNPDSYIVTKSTISDVPALPYSSPGWKFVLYSVLVQLSELAKRRGLNGQDFEVQAASILDTGVDGYNEMIQKFVHKVESHHRASKGREMGTGSGSMPLEYESSLVAFDAFRGYATYSGMCQEESEKIYDKIFLRFTSPTG